MAFSSFLANLRPMVVDGNAARPHPVWFYPSTDSKATVNTSGYFNSAADRLSVGDIIWCMHGATGTPPSSIMIVLSNDGTTVDVSDGLDITGTNSD